jgi:hypothetical protein
LTDPDPNTLKPAAACLLQVARSSQGGRYRKSAKIDALREYKGEILEAHRGGISIHRVAQIFRETECRHFYSAFDAGDPVFIAEEERTKDKTSAALENQSRSGSRRTPVRMSPAKSHNPHFRSL